MRASVGFGEWSDATRGIGRAATGGVDVEFNDVFASTHDITFAAHRGSGDPVSNESDRGFAAKTYVRLDLAGSCGRGHVAPSALGRTRSLRLALGNAR